jgi:hypothetical protein
MLGIDTRPLGIHTICYEPGMAQHVDPAFLPFDVTADPQPERRETAHMLNFWRQGLHRNYRVSGLLSPSFKKKTGFDGKMFHAFINNNPGFDVWFVNPYPASFYLAYNIWEHGEFWHPGLCERAAQVFKAANLAIDPRNFPRSTKHTLLFSNCWVATPAFWDQFMPFVDLVARHAEKIQDVSEDTFYVRQKASYWPFLFERLFTTFMVTRPDIKARYIQFEIPHILEMSGTRLQKLLIREWAPMIDRWDRIGTYGEDQRGIFRALQKLAAFAILGSDPEVQKIALDL